jgi:hypothetical protein
MASFTAPSDWENVVINGIDYYLDNKTRFIYGLNGEHMYSVISGKIEGVNGHPSPPWGEPKELVIDEDEEDVPDEPDDDDDDNTCSYCSQETKCLSINNTKYVCEDCAEQCWKCELLVEDWTHCTCANKQEEDDNEQHVYTTKTCSSCSKGNLFCVLLQKSSPEYPAEYICKDCSPLCWGCEGNFLHWDHCSCAK